MLNQVAFIMVHWYILIGRYLVEKSLFIRREQQLVCADQAPALTYEPAGLAQQPLTSIREPGQHTKIVVRLCRDKKP